MFWSPAPVKYLAIPMCDFFIIIIIIMYPLFISDTHHNQS